MKTLKNENELVEFINDNNFWFKGQNFDSYKKLEEAANLFFKENTESCENQEKYYNQFGLKVGECHLNDVKTEKYYIEESNIDVTVFFVEGYIDSGINEEDYFHGYYIVEN
jgi:hypothetical protein